MNVLVVGGGSIGQRHLRNLKSMEGVSVTACTRNADLESRLGIRTYSDLDEAWSSRPSAAVVANVTSEHIPVALAAAGWGCHLFIEKPLSNTPQGIGELIELQRQRQLVGLVGCNMRFHPALQVIKRALAEKCIGPVLSAQAHCGRYLPDWRPGRDYGTCYSSREAQGGGVVLDLIHELDYLYWFFGAVQAVTAFIGKHSALAIDTEDVADILLRFQCGLVAQVHLDYVQRTPTRGCRITGEEGTIIWSDEQGKVSLLKPSEPEQSLWVKSVGYDHNDMYVEEMRHFLGCIQTGQVPLVGLEDGKAVLDIALAAKRAAREGRVVEVCAIEDEQKCGS